MGAMQDLFDNLRTTHSAYYDAERERAEALLAWQKGCAERAGCKVADLDFTNISCTSRLTFGHVYKWVKPGGITGIGHRQCIFCQCDDFDL